MSRALRIGMMLAVAATAGCASAPKDAGFSEVRRTVIEQTRQPVEWDPSAPVLPPDDAIVQPLLQEELSPDRAVQIAFANNRDVQATLEELGIARGGAPGRGHDPQSAIPRRGPLRRQLPEPDRVRPRPDRSST